MLRELGLIVNPYKPIMSMAQINVNAKMKSVYIIIRYSVNQWSLKSPNNAFWDQKRILWNK